MTELGGHRRGPGGDLSNDDPRGRRTPCWPVPGSGPRTRSSSAASPRCPRPPDPGLRRRVVTLRDALPARCRRRVEAGGRQGPAALPRRDPCHWWSGAPARHRDDRGREVWWDEIVERQPAEHECEFSRPSIRLHHVHLGQHREAKGILHTTGGYVVGVHHALGELRPQGGVESSGRGRHRLGDRPLVPVYGPLTNATTSVMYEGTPATRTRAAGGRSREVRVTLLTGPTAIRTS